MKYGVKTSKMTFLSKNVTEAYTLDVEFHIGPKSGEKYTHLFRKDEIGLKLKLNISSFYFWVLTCPESVVSYCKMGR